MPNETEKTQEDIVEDVAVETEKTEDAEKSVEEQTEDGFFKATTGWIKNKLKGDSAEEDSAKQGDEDIPNTFSEAAEAAGWDAATIIKHATEGNNGKPFTNDELLEQIPHLAVKKVEEKAEEKIETKEATKEKEVDSATPDMKVIEELIEKKWQEKLAKENESIHTEFKELQVERQQQKDIDTWNTANKMFDEASKTFPIFGLTAELPVFPAGENKGELIPTSPQFKARSEVFGQAIVNIQAGQSIDESMANALYWYKGKNLEKDVERNVIKDLKKHEEQLSGSRVAKEVKKAYDNKRDEDIDFIRGLQRAQGQDV